MSNRSTIHTYDHPLAWRRGLLPALLVGIGGLLVGIAVSLGTQKLAVALALLVIPLALKWPVPIALGAFALALPFDAIWVVQSGSGSTTITWFISVAAGALLLARILTGVRETPPRVALWWLLLFAWGTTTCLWALDSTPALKRLPIAWSLLIFYLVAVSSRITRKQLTFVIAMAILGGCAAAAWASWGYLNGVSWIGGRASLVLGDKEMDPNYFAAMLLVPLSFALGMFLSVRKWSAKILLTVAIALIGTSIFLSLSRGALLALICLLAVYAYRLRVSLRAVAVFALLLAVLAATAPTSFWKRLQPDVVRTGSGRTDIWAAGSQMLKHNVLQGVGLANFPVAYNYYAGAAPKFQGYFRDSHNTYLNILAEQGLIGLVLYFFALIYQFRGLRVKSSSGQARAPLIVSCEATLVSLLAAAFFIDFLLSKAFWFTLILCTLVSRLELGTEAASSRHLSTGRELATADAVPADPIFTR